MFTDPQSVTVSGTANSLPRTGSGVNAGAFATADGAMSLQIANQYGKRIRRSISIQSKKYASDPTNPTLNKPVNATVRLTVDQPLDGFSNADLTALVVGFLANLTASTNANIGKLLGGEN